MSHLLQGVGEKGLTTFFRSLSLLAWAVVAVQLLQVCKNQPKFSKNTEGPQTTFVVLGRPHLSGCNPVLSVRICRNPWYWKGVTV